jgi:hypothetical protein
VAVAVPTGAVEDCVVWRGHSMLAFSEAVGHTLDLEFVAPLKPRFRDEGKGSKGPISTERDSLVVRTFSRCRQGRRDRYDGGALVGCRLRRT